MTTGQPFLGGENKTDPKFTSYPEINVKKNQTFKHKKQ